MLTAIHCLFYLLYNKSKSICNKIYCNTK